MAKAKVQVAMAEQLSIRMPKLNWVDCLYMKRNILHINSNLAKFVLEKRNEHDDC